MFNQLASKYENALLNHTSEVASVESSIRSLSYFLPGRFRDAELASETLVAGTNMLSSWHDSILSKAAAQKWSASERPKPSSHARYTAAWRDASGIYSACAKALTLIHYTELLLEMVALKKTGKKGKWRAVVLIELAKVVLRLALFKNTQSRSMIEPPLPQREIDPALFQQQQTQPSATANGSPSTWTGARSGRTYPSIASLSTPDPAARFHGSASTSASRQKQPTNAAIQALLSKNAISVGDMKQPRELLAKLESFSDRWNEILYILRPLLYVLALQRWGRRAVTPFALSFAIEYLTVKTSSSKAHMSDLDREEQGRRQLDLLKYLLRGPVWDGFTRPRLASVASGIEKIPLLGIAGTVLKDYLDLYERYVYYVGP